jgi:uncharacterized membrane protein
MDWFLTYSGLFFLGGIAGWVVELFFRRFVSQKKWVNPGFLTGPLLPLYGFGVVGFYLFSNTIPWNNISANSALNTTIEILCVGVLMTVIELIAGLIFIKGMKIKLWDYSSRWGNFEGIICPLFSAIWTACGALYVLWVNPVFVAYTNFLLSNSMATGMLEGFAYGILSVDIGWSFGLVSKIRKAAADKRLVVDWDKIKVSFHDHLKRAKKTPDWFLPFKTKQEQFAAMMSEYVEGLRLETAQRAAVYQKKQQLRLEKRKERLSRHHHKEEK